MIRAQRMLALTLIAATAAVACKKKPQTAVVPATNNNVPAPTCDKRCQDSIAASDARKRAYDDSVAKARADMDARNRARAAAVAALQAKIYFEYDQADLSGDARSTLDAKVPVMRSNPAIRIRISGHADERGSDEYNLALGQRRAAAAKRYLTDQGIDPGRIETVSYGEQRPAADGHDESAYRQNRRDEFEITAGSESMGASGGR